ncbi:MAG: diguanylate cyclase [Proteobacteria bacterium]|nr:diguanylate cyclase [Pseudomonadota bacterium]
MTTDTLRQRRLTDVLHEAAESLDLSTLMEEVARMRRKLAEQERLIKTLRKDAMTDALTGLYNRRAFESELRRSVSNARRYDRTNALLLIDLNGFKAINDNMGHQVGDIVLEHVASVLRQNTRTNDVVARLGGDEFCIILNEIRRSEDAYNKAASIAERLSAMPVILEDGHQVYAHASIGTRVFSADDDYESIIADADERMYADKKADKN